MRLRIEKNRHRLSGIHTAAKFLTELVPQGRGAIDAGAYLGLYSYWISRNASVVHSFEPNPVIFETLKSAANRKIRAYNIGLSDRERRATLHVPIQAAGDSTLNAVGYTNTIRQEVPVELRTLDSFEFADIGFIKIDVEGHETELLQGAIETIQRERPVIFIELEERHKAGVVLETVRWMNDVLGYTETQFLKYGRLHPISEFNATDDQLRLSSTPSSPAYVNNFLFRP